MRHAWRWVAATLSHAVQHYVGLIILLGVVATASGAAHNPVNPTIRWVIVSLVIVLGIGTLLLLWRSRTRLERDAAEERNEALLTRAETSEELCKIQALEHGAELAQLRGQIAALAEELECERRARIYERMRSDVMAGLLLALSKHLPIAENVVGFVEDNSLRLIHDTLMGVLAQDGVAPRIEIGIACETPGGYAVTHASGSLTGELKAKGECFVARTFEDVVEGKAKLHFDGGDSHVVPLSSASSPQYLFVVSTATLGVLERKTLELHGGIIDLTRNLCGLEDAA